MSQRCRGLADLLNISKDFVEAMRSLPGDYKTPCGRSNNPNSWVSPRTRREYESAVRQCFAECPLVDACRKFGEETKQSGVYGGAYLSKGHESTNLPFGTRVSAKDRAETTRQQREVVQDVARDFEEVWRQMAAESGVVSKITRRVAP